MIITSADQAQVTFAR